MNLALLRARRRILSDQPLVPSVGLSLSTSAVTIAQNGTATLTVFATRSGGFVGTVTPSALSLPSGVSGAFAPATMTGTTAQAVLTLSAQANASPVTAANVTIQIASSLGVQTVPLAVTVVSDTTTGQQPVVLGVSPSSGAPNATRSITISGSEFIAGATVHVGVDATNTWTPATGVTVVSLNAITCTAPALALGTYDVRVTTANGVGRLFNAISYGAVPFFEDNFAGGQRNNANGFAWTTQLGGVTVSDEAAPPGATHSLRFAYPQTTASESVEQRFALGRDCTSLGIEWQWFVPSNYFHPTTNGNNNKLYSLWGASSSLSTARSLGTHLQVGEFWEDPNEVGGSVLRTMRNSPSGAASSILTPASLRPPLIGVDGPVLPGQWNVMRYFTRLSSAAGVSDGVIKLWANGTLVANHTGLLLWLSDGSSLPSASLAFGYLLGAANSGWNVPTTFYCGNFKFFDSDPGWT